MIGGDQLSRADPSFDGRSGEPVLSFAFKSGAARTFGRFTAENIGRRFAIVLDGRVLTAPRIISAIPDGTGQITGNFTVEETTKLAIQLRSGALPAPLTIVEERTVGPSLGADSIKAGKIATIIGGLLVVAFMLFAYGLFGVFAVVAVAINIAMVLAVMAWGGFSLTLPGIAGILLTIGMAVDANVLIYERIREELRNRSSPVECHREGLRSRLRHHRRRQPDDADRRHRHVLARLRPHQGFRHHALARHPDDDLHRLHRDATSRVVVARRAAVETHRGAALTSPLPLDGGEGARRAGEGRPLAPCSANSNTGRACRRPSPRPSPEEGWRETRGASMAHFKGIDFFPHGLRLPVVKNRRYFIGISWAMAILSAILILTNGLNFGVDFKGGSIIEVRSKSGPVDLTRLRDIGNAAGVGGVQVQGFSIATDALIRMEMQPGGDEAQQVATKKLIAALGDGFDVRNTEIVGAVVSEELKRWGIYAVVASLVGIMLYIWFRFEWQFAVAGILALVHDVFITCGMFALLRYEFDLSVVAALLTLAGYSVNDTVVVFDRIRENMRRYKKMPLWDLIDLSINETLSRTVLTAGTVFLAVLALYVFGTR